MEREAGYHDPLPVFLPAERGLDRRIAAVRVS